MDALGHTPTLPVSVQELSPLLSPRCRGFYCSFSLLVVDLHGSLLYPGTSCHYNACCGMRYINLLTYLPACLIQDGRVDSGRRRTCTGRRCRRRRRLRVRWVRSTGRWRTGQRRWRWGTRRLVGVRRQQHGDPRRQSSALTLLIRSPLPDCILLTQTTYVGL